MLKSKYEKNLRIDSGLILRCDVMKTNSFDRARRLKLKYKRLAQQSSSYAALITNKQPGRHPSKKFRSDLKSDLMPDHRKILLKILSENVTGLFHFLARSGKIS